MPNQERLEFVSIVLVPMPNFTASEIFSVHVWCIIVMKRRHLASRIHCIYMHKFACRSKTIGMRAKDKNSNGKGRNSAQ